MIQSPPNTHKASRTLPRSHPVCPHSFLTRRTRDPLLFARGAQLAEDKDFVAALADLEKANELAPDIEGIDSLLAKVQKSARNQQVQKWIAQSLAVAKDAKKCGEPQEISDTWTDLKNVTKKDRLYRKAVAATKKLERCRKKASQSLVKIGRDFMKTQREEWAKKYETALLDEGMDVRVHLGGTWKTRVKIVYVLFNRAWSHQITDGGSMKPGSFLANMQDMGFKRVTFADGYSESFYYDLDPLRNEGVRKDACADGFGESPEVVTAVVSWP